jgi:hypothetical protein
VNNNIPYQQSKPKQEEKREKLSPFAKRILIVDKDPDTTLTFRRAFEEANRIGGGGSKIFFLR